MTMQTINISTQSTDQAKKCVKYKQKLQYSVDKMDLLIKYQKSNCVLWMHEFKSPLAVLGKSLPIF